MSLTSHKFKSNKIINLIKSTKSFTVLVAPKVTLTWESAYLQIKMDEYYFYATPILSDPQPTKPATVKRNQMHKSKRKKIKL